MNNLNYVELYFSEGYNIIGELTIVDGWFQLTNKDGVQFYNPHYIWKIVPLTEADYLKLISVEELSF